MNSQLATKASGKSVLQRYLEDGFVVFDTELASLLSEARGAFVSIFDILCRAKNYGPISSDLDISRLYRSLSRELWVSAYNQLRYLPEVSQFSSHPEILSIIKELGLQRPSIGSPCPVRADMPHDPKWDFGLHQDYAYNQDSFNSITLWIAFQNTSVSMGALEVIPGSHAKGSYVSRDGIIESNPYPEGAFIKVPIQLGQVLAFSSFLLHRSGKNISDSIRFSCQLRFNDLCDPSFIDRNYPINFQTQIKSLVVDFPTYFPSPKNVETE